MHSNEEETEERFATFEGPIEKGETSHLPLEPEPGQAVTEDCFTLVSDVFSNENLISIVLPKLILSTTNIVAEQSLLLLTYRVDHEPSTFKMVLEAAKKGVKKFEIHFKNSDDSENESVWKFHNVRVHATDFGYATRQRVETAQIAVELTYSKIVVDDFEF